MLRKPPTDEFAGCEDEASSIPAVGNAIRTLRAHLPEHIYSQLTNGFSLLRISRPLRRRLTDADFAHFWRDRLSTAVGPYRNTPQQPFLLNPTHPIQALLGISDLNRCASATIAGFRCCRHILPP